MKQQRQQGYTLIFVVMIIFMLGIIMLYSFDKFFIRRQSLAVSVTTQEMKNLLEAAQNYYLDYGHWPSVDFAGATNANNYRPNNEDELNFYHYYYPGGNIWWQDEEGKVSYTSRPYYFYYGVSALTGQTWPDLNLYLPEIDPLLLISPLLRTSKNNFIVASEQYFWKKHETTTPYPQYLTHPYYELQVMNQHNSTSPAQTQGGPDPSSSSYFGVALRGIDNQGLANQVLGYLPGYYDAEQQTVYTVTPQPQTSFNYSNKLGRIQKMGKARVNSTGPPTVGPWTDKISMPDCTSGYATQDGSFYYPAIFFAPIEWRTTFNTIPSHNKKGDYWDLDEIYWMEERQRIFYKQTCYKRLPTTPSSETGYWRIGMRSVALGYWAHKIETRASATFAYFTTCLAYKPSSQYRAMKSMVIPADSRVTRVVYPEFDSDCVETAGPS
jgi:type II secretory pathway pseudopilin PulG